MPSTRRRFLAGATALAGVLPGCNDTTSRAVRETMTPVDVPRTDREILQEAAAIDAPTIPSAVVVGEAHLESAIGHLERLRRSLETHVDPEGTPEYETGVGPGRTYRDAVEYVEERIARAREMGPSDEALDALRRTLRDAARVVGRVRAEAGDLTAADVESGLEAERAAVRAIRDDLEYRVATPVVDFLPTVYAAERAIGRFDRDPHPRVEPARAEDAAADPETTTTPAPTPTPEPAPEHLAERYHRLERARRRRDDVEQYLATATDEAAPSIRTALASEVADVRAELEPIAEEYRAADGEPAGGSVAVNVKALRRSVGERAARHLSRTPAEPADGELVEALFEGVRTLVAFRSVDAGVRETLERLDGRRFPTAELLPAKRRAVENFEAAAGEPALHRRFVETAPQLLRSAEGRHGEETVTVEDVARTHLHYVGAAEWAARGVSRAEATSASLQAQQS